jgi:cyclohexanone monooxygenase
VSEAERLATYEESWNAGGFMFLSGSFADIGLDEGANKTAADFVRSKIDEIVRDQETAAALKPWDFPIGAKRLPLDTGYYQTFNRPNVTLVDLKRTPIEEITATGIRTSAGHHDLDMIVYATGFDALTGPLEALRIRGRGGQRLTDAWRAGPRTYLGLAMPGFPNLFTITGPGSPSVLSNMPVSIEQHVEWIGDCLARLRERGAGVIEATEEATAAWTEHVQQAASRTLHPKAASWYMGANIPGKPRLFLPYIGGVGSYRDRCDAVAASDYAGFTLSGSREGAGEDGTGSGDGRAA